MKIRDTGETRQQTLRTGGFQRLSQSQELYCLDKGLGDDRIGVVHAETMEVGLVNQKQSNVCYNSSVVYSGKSCFSPLNESLHVIK